MWSVWVESATVLWDVKEGRGKQNDVEELEKEKKETHGWAGVKNVRIKRMCGNLRRGWKNIYTHNR